MCTAVGSLMEFEGRDVVVRSIVYSGSFLCKQWFRSLFTVARSGVYGGSF